jgi:hypothetical protein
MTANMIGRVMTAILYGGLFIAIIAFATWVLGSNGLLG